MTGLSENKDAPESESAVPIFGAARPEKKSIRFTKKRGALGLFFLLALALCVFVIYRWRKPFQPAESTVGAALGRGVPGFLVELHEKASSRGELLALEDRVPRLLDEKTREALGADGSAFLESMLRAAAELPSEAADQHDVSDRFFKESTSLNQALQSRGLPYFIDADILVGTQGRAHMPMLFSFYIEREATLTGENQRVRVISVHRLDRLNIGQAFLGYTRPRTSAALVLLHEIESQLVQYVLPALADVEEPLLLDTDSIDRGKMWQRELHQRSTEIVKNELASMPSVNQENLLELGTLLARRRKMVRGWQLALDRQNIRLRLPRERIPEADYAHDLFGHIAMNELREWNEIHERLTDKAPEAAFYAVRDRFARSVEVHEAQHRLDYARGMVGLPEKLAALMGAENTLDLPEGGLYARTRDELSAYLAEIAFQQSMPMLELLLLARFAFDAEQWGGAYCYAALGVIDALGRELGLPEAKLIGYRTVLREELTERFLAISRKPPEEIRAAAKRAWTSYFGAPLAELTLSHETNHQPWRH